LQDTLRLTKISVREKNPDLFCGGPGALVESDDVTWCINYLNSIGWRECQVCQGVYNCACCHNTAAIRLYLKKPGHAKCEQSLCRDVAYGVKVIRDICQYFGEDTLGNNTAGGNGYVGIVIERAPDE